MSSPAVIRSRWAQAIMVAVPLLVILAIVAVRSRAPEHDAAGASGPLVPTLRESAGDLTRIELQRGDDGVVVELRDGSWVIGDDSRDREGDRAPNRNGLRDGHPVRVDRVQELVRSIAALQLEQPMTEQPSRHADLGLAWPDDRGEATLVRLFVRDRDEPLAEIVLGRDRWSPRSQYVRHLAENRTWRALGAARADASVIGFIDESVARVPASEFVRIDYPGGTLRPDENGVWKAVAEHEDGTPPLLLAPGSDEDAEGARREAAEWALPELLFRLDADDIRHDRDEPATAEFRYHAADGAIVVGMIPIGDEWWMRLRWHPHENGESSPDRLEGDDAREIRPATIADRIAENAQRWPHWLYRMPSWRMGRILPVIETPALPEHDEHSDDHSGDEHIDE